MTGEALSDWVLFGDAWLAGGFIAALLALVGVVVVLRGQIFLGAALAQASTLGVAAALALSGGLLAGRSWAASDSFVATMGGVVAALAALAASGKGDAAAGWVFLASSSLSVLLVSDDPHGLEEIRRLATSSLVSAGRGEARLFGALAVTAAFAVAAAHRRILLVATDPEMAAATGLRAARWRAALAVATALAVGLSVRCGGALYAFACLALPALAARGFCRTMRGMLIAAPVVALLAAAAGFAAAHRWDWPPGQTAAALLSALVPLGNLAGALRRRLRP